MNIRETVCPALVTACVGTLATACTSTYPFERTLPISYELHQPLIEKVPSLYAQCELERATRGPLDELTGPVCTELAETLAILVEPTTTPGSARLAELWSMAVHELGLFRAKLAYSSACAWTLTLEDDAVVPCSEGGESGYGDGLRTVDGHPRPVTTVVWDRGFAEIPSLEYSCATSIPAGDDHAYQRGRRDVACEELCVRLGSLMLDRYGLMLDGYDPPGCRIIEAVEAGTQMGRAISVVFTVEIGQDG